MAGMLLNARIWPQSAGLLKQAGTDAEVAELRAGRGLAVERGRVSARKRVPTETVSHVDRASQNRRVCCRQGSCVDTWGLHAVPGGLGARDACLGGVVESGS